MSRISADPSHRGSPSGFLAVYLRGCDSTPARLGGGVGPCTGTARRHLTSRCACACARACVRVQVRVVMGTFDLRTLRRAGLELVEPHRCWVAEAQMQVAFGVGGAGAARSAAQVCAVRSDTTTT
jgi:hypothetical protein